MQYAINKYAMHHISNQSILFHHIVHLWNQGRNPDPNCMFNRTCMLQGQLSLKPLPVPLNGHACFQGQLSLNPYLFRTTAHHGFRVPQCGNRVINHINDSKT